RSIHRVQYHPHQIRCCGDLQQLSQQFSKPCTILIPTSPQRRVVRIAHTRQPQHSDVVITSAFPAPCAANSIHVSVENHLDLQAHRVCRPACFCHLCLKAQFLQIQ